jgi:chorismate mutase
MEITLNLVEKLNEHFDNNIYNTLAMNAVGRVDLQELAVNRELVKSIRLLLSLMKSKLHQKQQHNKELVFAGCLQH